MRTCCTAFLATLAHLATPWIAPRTPFAAISHISYMDDLLSVATDPSPTGVLAKAKRAAPVAFSVLVAHGMGT